jgi:hypothetical protein
MDVVALQGRMGSVALQPNVRYPVGMHWIIFRVCSPVLACGWPDVFCHSG